MSSTNEPSCIAIKKKCIKCKVCIMNLLKCFKYCYTDTEKKDTDNDTIQLSNTDFNKKRTPSMNDYIVTSYINKQPTNESNETSKDVELEVPKQSEKIVRV